MIFQEDKTMSKRFPITVSSWTLGDQCTFEERVVAAKNAGYCFIWMISFYEWSSVHRTE